MYSEHVCFIPFIDVVQQALSGAGVLPHKDMVDTASVDKVSDVSSEKKTPPAVMAKPKQPTQPVNTSQSSVTVSHILFCMFLWWWFGVVGSDIGQINEVALHWARLVLGWVTHIGVQLPVQEIYRSLINHPG